MLCVGFRPGHLRVTSCHDKMDLAISALEDPGDIIYHASSLYPYFSLHCLLRMPSESEGKPTAWLQDNDCPRSPHCPQLYPGFCMWPKNLFSFPHKYIPHAEPGIVCLHIMIVLYHFILPSWALSLVGTYSPKAEENWSGWGRGTLGGRNAALEWQLQDVQGQGTNSNMFETINKNSVLWVRKLVQLWETWGSEDDQSIWKWNTRLLVLWWPPSLFLNNLLRY